MANLRNAISRNADAMKRPLRICLITGEYPPMQGGVGDYTALLAHHLTAAGHAVLVSTAGAPDDPADASPEVCRNRRDWGYRDWWDIGRRAAEWKADIVHIQYQAAAYRMHPAANVACLLLRRRFPSSRIVVTFHDLKVPFLFPKAGPVRRLAVSVLAATADTSIVTNADDAKRLRSDPLSRRRPSTVIPIGSNVAVGSKDDFNKGEWRLSLGIKPDELLLVFFGFVGQSKGVHLLLDAVAELASRGHRLRLLMIGGMAGDSDSASNRYAADVRALCERPPLCDHIIWTGFVDERTVSRHLLAGDFCVLPYREGASFSHGTLIAAIAHGLPVLSTYPIGVADGPVGGIDRLRPLESGRNVLLVPYGNADDLVKAIELLRRSPGLARRLRNGALALAPQFEWQDIAAQTIDLYRKLLKPR